MNVQMRHLRAFIEVARYGAFTRAAEALGISQPALTLIINQFEDQLGFRLFDRTTRRVYLSLEGAAFLPTAERLVEQFDAALAELRATGDARRGRVSISAVPSAAMYLLPTAIKAFSERYPSVGVNISDANSNTVLQRVLRQEVDFGIGSFAEDTPELELLPLAKDDFGVVCRSDHPLGRSSAKLYWKDLKDYPFLGLDQETGIYPILKRVEALPESVRRPQYVVANMAALEGLLRAGLGITAVPELAVPSRNHPKLVFRPLFGPKLARTISLAKRKDKTLSHPAKHLQRMICEMNKDTSGKRVPTT